MAEPLALITVNLTAIYLVVIALVSFFLPAKAAGFLNSFVSSARAHVMEMLLRLLIGWALLIHPNHMLYGPAFRFFWLDSDHHFPWTLAAAVALAQEICSYCGSPSITTGLAIWAVFTAFGIIPSLCRLGRQQ